MHQYLPPTMNSFDEEEKSVPIEEAEKQFF